MPRRSRNPRPHPLRQAPLTPEERRSLTHGDFWIPDPPRGFYRHVLRTLNAAGVPFVISGAYAVYEYTDIYRETKDLDVFLAPEAVPEAARALRAAGYRTRLEQAHWIAKALDPPHFVDLIFGMGNGLALVDDEWYRHSVPGIVAGEPVRLAPVEEMIWHRLFVAERHRHDLADNLHLILVRGPVLDWTRLRTRVGEHWPLLLAHLLVFLYVYPEIEGRIPRDVLAELLERAQEEINRPRSGAPVTRGTLISRFSFAIDTHEWGWTDARAEATSAMERHPAIRQLAHAEVWDELSPMAQDYRRRVPPP